MTVKELLNGLWQFCSYLFWPQWGRNNKYNNKKAYNECI